MDEYNDDAGEFHLTPYDAFPAQLYSYSNVEHIPKYYYYNTTSQVHPGLNFSEPKVTIHAANYLDDTVFEEYDPTPYSGGYDIAQTYGEPLPPSKEICYPPCVSGSNSLDSFDYGSIPSPYLNQLEETQKQSKDEKEKTNQEEDILIKPAEEEDFGVGNGSIGEYGYDYGSQLQKIPYGSGLEAVDICESLFGYWPCLDKQKQDYINTTAHQDHNEQWKSTADYLFGNPFGRDDSYEDFSFSNQNYYYHQQQPP